MLIVIISILIACIAIPPKSLDDAGWTIALFLAILVVGLAIRWLIRRA